MSTTYITQIIIGITLDKIVKERKYIKGEINTYDKYTGKVTGKEKVIKDYVKMFDNNIFESEWKSDKFSYDKPEIHWWDVFKNYDIDIELFNEDEKTVEIIKYPYEYDIKNIILGRVYKDVETVFKIDIEKIKKLKEYKIVEKILKEKFNLIPDILVYKYIS